MKKFKATASYVTYCTLVIEANTDDGDEVRRYQIVATSESVLEFLEQQA